jgi:Sec-independent protein secretion pathway component TatC
VPGVSPSLPLIMMCLIWWNPLSSPTIQTTQLHPVVGATFFARLVSPPKSLDGMRMNRGEGGLPPGHS